MHLVVWAMPVQPPMSRVCRASRQLPPARAVTAASVTPRNPWRDRHARRGQPRANALTAASVSCTHHVRLASLRAWHAPRDATAASAPGQPCNCQQGATLSPLRLIMRAEQMPGSGDCRSRLSCCMDMMKCSLLCRAGARLVAGMAMCVTTS